MWSGSASILDTHPYTRQSLTLDALHFLAEWRHSESHWAVNVADYWTRPQQPDQVCLSSLCVCAKSIRGFLFALLPSQLELAGCHSSACPFSAATRLCARVWQRIQELPNGVTLCSSHGMQRKNNGRSIREQTSQWKTVACRPLASTKL